MRQAGPEAASQGPAPPSTCDNCGASSAATDLAPVRRVYVQVGPDGALVGGRPEAGVEWWCTPCRTLYPSEPAGDPDERAGT